MMLRQDLPYALTILLFTFCKPATAQKTVALVNLSLTRPEKGVMYTDTDNRIMIKGELPGKYIRLERSNGSVDLRAGTQLTALIRYTVTGTDTFRVYSGEELILEKIYEVKNPGKYAARLYMMRDTALGREDLKAAGKLELYMPDTYYKPNEKIVSYTLAAYMNGKRMKTWKCEGNRFPEDFITFVQQQPAGAQFHFENILFSHKTKGIQTAPSIRILLKD